MNKNILVLIFTFLSTLGKAQIPAYLSMDGLQAYWPFNGNANDQTVNAHNLFNTGATLATDRFGNGQGCYSFANGATLEYNGNSISGGDAFTFSFWMKTNSNINWLLDYIFTETGINSDGIETGIWFFFDQNSKNLGIVNPAIAYYSLISQPFPGIDEWHHVTVVGPNIYRLYIDGVLVASTFDEFVPIANPCQFKIGCFNGAIDDFAIYSRKLTVEEIFSVYANSASTQIENPIYTGNNTNATTQSISYQAIARNAQGQMMINQPVQIKFNIITGNANGPSIYSELHNLNTNSQGLFTTSIGTGTPVSGTYPSIDWTDGNKFLKVEMNTANGFIDLGTQQMLAVPYSIRSNTSAKSGTIENANLPVYSDNAAALSGGLVAGQMYRTTSGALMIVY